MSAVSARGLKAPVTRVHGFGARYDYLADPQWVFGAIAVGLLGLLFCQAIILDDPVAALVFAQVPLGVALMLRSPFFVSILFVTFSFFRVHEAVPLLKDMRIPFYLSVLSIAGFGLWVALAQRATVRLQPQLKAFIVLAALVSAGTLIAWDPAKATDSWSENFVKIIIMILICALIAERPRHLTVTAVCFMCGGMVLSVILMWNKVYKIGLVEGSRAVVVPDSKSLLGDPNDIALMILSSFAIACALAVSKVPWLMRLFASAATVIIFGGLVATQSRGGFLGVLIVLLVILMWRLRSPVVTGLILATVFAGMFVMMGLGSRSSGSEIVAGGLDESAGNRLIAWRAAFKMASYHPFNGVGLSGFTPNFYDYADTWVDHAMAVHSAWFEVMAETGFLGLAVFVTMIVLIGRSIFRDLTIIAGHPGEDLLQALALGLLAAYCSYLVSASFVTHGFTWPIYGILVASVILEKCARALELPKAGPAPGAERNLPRAPSWVAQDGSETELKSYAAASA